MTIPFQLKGLDHIVLRVTDLDRSRAFYEGIIGCHLERELPDLGLYQLRLGHHLIDLVTVGSKLGGELNPEPSRRNQDHFCISVLVDGDGGQDVENTLLEYLERTGVTVLESGERYGAEGVGWSVYVKDPDDNVVELKVSASA